MILLAAFGCGGGSPSGFALTPGSSILTPSVTRVVFTSMGGGLRPFPPAGAACDTGKWSYTVSFDSGRLAADKCRVQGPFELAASYVPVHEDIELSVSQRETLKAAVHAVTVSDRTDCGADGASRDFRVESARGGLTYGDDFYACLKQYEHHVIWESLDNLEAYLGTFPF